MKTRIHVVQGDITKLAVDVIVNAANPSLMGGGGVDGAIHRAAGPALLDACLKVRQQQGDCPTGHAVITLAGDLPAKAVVHTVGPVWRGGTNGEPDLLANCYFRSVELAADRGVSSLAFPSISTGIYGYPIELAARVAINAVRESVAKSVPLQEVVFCCFSAEDLSHYERILSEPTA